MHCFLIIRLPDIQPDKRTAWEIIEDLLNAVPYRIHTIMTDNLRHIAMVYTSDPQVFIPNQTCELQPNNADVPRISLLSMELTVT